MKKYMNKFLLIPFILMTFSHQAAAYLDPGPGSMILQGIIAGVAVVGLTIKTYWYKIRGFFGKGSPVSLLEDEDDSLKPEDQ